MSNAELPIDSIVQSRATQLSMLFEQSPSFMALLDGPDHRFAQANPNYLSLVGDRPVLGLTVAEALPDAQAQGYGVLLDRVYATGEPYVAVGSKYSRQVVPGGPVQVRYLDFVYQPIRDAGGKISGIFVEGFDVSERTRMQALQLALIRMTDEFEKLADPDDFSFTACRVIGEALEVSRVGYGNIDPVAETLHVERDWTSPGIETLAGVTALRDYGSFIDSLKQNEFINIADVRDDPRTSAAAPALEGRSARAFLNVPVVEQGVLVAVLFVNHAERRDWTAEELLFLREAAQRARTAVERARAVLQLRASNELLEQRVKERTDELMQVEERFRQSQKMEAIGQLTGGIAHDFNNLLAAISGSLQVLDRRLSKGLFDNNQHYLSMAMGSVKRAASLTQRLLAFSRRQTLDAKTIDVNRLVGNLEDLIRRTVGPSVSVEVVGAGGLWLTKVDAPQLENALLNLCINARDAMAPDGGRLTIETANKWLDESSAAQRDLKPGQYISLCVSDTGSGMTPEVSARAFDPFFTTKPMGQGTGLGLSMVYGFVRQSGGQVRIYSEVGRGTTMCLYLPRQLGDAQGEAPQPSQRNAVDSMHSEGECVLVVEDEEVVREIVVDLLEGQGYIVLSAVDGASAQRLFDSDRKIDLLLTDVGLPGGTNGRQLADAARVARPQLKVVFMTGYAENAIVGNGFLEHGMEVITKPFDLEALASKIRMLIERG